MEDIKKKRKKKQFFSPTGSSQASETKLRLVLYTVYVRSFLVSWEIPGIDVLSSSFHVLDLSKLSSFEVFFTAALQGLMVTGAALGCVCTTVLYTLYTGPVDTEYRTLLPTLVGYQYPGGIQYGPSFGPSLDLSV